MERMTLQVMEVVSMLLVRAGIETHPGPAYRMYLVWKPLLVESSQRLKKDLLITCMIYTRRD